MRTLTGIFGFEELLTFLLPGMIALLAVVIGCSEWSQGDLPLTEHAQTLVQWALCWAREAEFGAGLFVILALAALLGTVTASLQAALETWILDWITRKRIRQEPKEFKEVWKRYLGALGRTPNHYINRVLLFYQFETRLGLTLILLSLMVWWRVHWLAGVGVLVVAVFMYFMGAAHHKELAEYRKDHFGSGELTQASGDPSPTLQGE